MASQETFYSALTNRSLRNVRSELEFLAESAVITTQQLSSILSQLPNSPSTTESQRQVSAPSDPSPVQQPVPTQTLPSPAPYSPPTTQFANTTLNEKAQYGMNPPPPQQHYASPPPAYPQAPTILSIASALYAYSPTDPGDLALQPHDRVQVLEHMNADWWRGRNERTNLEGIFPRSYVNVLDEKPAPSGSGYGNMPLEVSQSGSPSTPGKANKFEEHGKKFGKKMGNAAIFGAGATIGSNIVNSIF
ncbi:SH3 domain-containing protein [Aspergillus pseudodeflectus]|uniref:SH3 domain-containing protein n=1 Tax=Aspergillus pseudodeflectus TaxID=176178 RepID=A0ABR4JC89_9EURO